MSEDPLSSIPPLIPLPSGSGTPNLSSEDHLSTLTAPSNISTHIFQTSQPRSTPVEYHTRKPSSDFGAFVSVDASDDPLRSLWPSDSQTSPISNPSDTKFFHDFGEEAKERTAKDGSRILNEILEHEKDPVQWLERPAGVEENKVSQVVSSPGDSGTSGTATPMEVPPMRSPMIDLGEDTSTLEHRLRQSTLDDDGAFAAAVSARKPLEGSMTLPLPITSTRPKSPPPRGSLSRSPGSFSTPTMSRSWISSFLPHARSSTLGSSSSAHTPEASLNEAPIEKPQWHHTMPSSLPSHAGVPNGVSTFSISGLPGVINSSAHTSILDPRPFVPPSGAPGFTGGPRWGPLVYDASDMVMKSVALTGRKAATKPVMTVALADTLRPHLPPLAKLAKNWQLLYSLDQDGISLKTLYTKCEEDTAGALVIMQNADGGVFGAWVGDGVHLSMSKGSYYGTGDSFLWSCIHPKHPAKTTHVYKWTGKNNYVALCEPGYISFGGGDGHYGLYLDDTLIDGTTHSCPTFENECLSSGEKYGQMIKFECVGLEVWSIGL